MIKNTKKIKITEGQLRMIRLLEDNSSAVDAFGNQAKRIENVIDGLWNKVTFMGINEIGDQREALNGYLKDLDRLDSAATKIGEEKEAYLGTHEFDDAMSELDLYVDDLISTIRTKKDMLTSVISHILEVDKVIRSTRGRFPEPTEVG